MENQKLNYFWGILRLFIGLIFIWAFFDKIFGLGFSTAPNKSWLLGNSPTYGFLALATKGPFASIYQSMAGNMIVDWIFMIGLLLVGLGLTLGIMANLASIGGAIMLILMWTAVLPPPHHPFIDDHLIYSILLIGLIFVHAGRYLGFGKFWIKYKFVKNHPILE